jgi:hypothetical protein
MSTRKISRKRRLREYVEARALAVVDEGEWNRIAELLAPVSPRRLRALLAESGVRVLQPWAGVHQHDFAALERSLLEMLDAYQGAMEAGDRVRARLCRRTVIQSKDHARLAASNPRTDPRKREEKEEMVRWMLVWLENPCVFPEWARLRKRVPGPHSPAPGDPLQEGH